MPSNLQESHDGLPEPVQPPRGPVLAGQVDVLVQLTREEGPGYTAKRMLELTGITPQVCFSHAL